jgi:hypothetical protein
MLTPGSLVPLAKLSSLRELFLELCYRLEVGVLEQLLSSAVQGNALWVQVTIKQGPSPPAAPQQQHQQELDAGENGQPTEQDYRDVYSRVVAARGADNTPRLTIELETEEEDEHE